MRTLTISHSEQQTEAAGRALAARLTPGAWVLLFGDLGAGKTAFVRGMASALGIDVGDVSSPTFTLIQEYRGRWRLFHVDLYRLAAGEADHLGLEELDATGGVIAVEWAEKLGAAVQGAIEVRIRDLGGNVRAIEISEVPDGPTPTGSSALPS